MILCNLIILIPSVGLVFVESPDPVPEDFPALGSPLDGSSSSFGLFEDFLFASS